MTPEMEAAIARGVGAGITFRPAAAAAAITALEERIGRPLPVDVRSFYEAHDGAVGVGVAAYQDLMPVEEIMESWTMLRTVWSEIDVPTMLEVSTWLPVTHDGGGSFLCVASDGAVVRYWVSGPNGERVARSFTDWLATVEWIPDED